jgi:hypothetical protein
MTARIATGETTEPPFTSLDGALAIAVGAAHVHLPAKAPSHPKRLDFHENKRGTDALPESILLGATGPNRQITQSPTNKIALNLIKSN